MKKILLTVAATLVMMPSMAAPNADKFARSTATICEGKASAEAYVKALSDYELLRGITNIMSDPRAANFRSAHELSQWLQSQTDCTVWADGTFLIEVKWLYNEAAARGLTTTINKVAQGTLRWNPTQDRFEERQEGSARWIPWTAYLK